MLADDGIAILYPGDETVLVGNHGGLSPQELRVPLLVAQP